MFADKMHHRCLGFALLVCFPGMLLALRAVEPCPDPKLDDGFFVLEEDANSHERKLIYACNNGYKPAVEGWWATSTCQNGAWSPKPQCIDEKACLSADIPNAIYTQSENGWYGETVSFRITCDDGFYPKHHRVIARCMNGSWATLPVCEKRSNACPEPTKVPHAVIIQHKHQDVFAVNSQVKYQCKDGYTLEGDNPVFCIDGEWTGPPTCSADSTPNTGHSGSTGQGGERRCTLQPLRYARYGIRADKTIYTLSEGQEKYLHCQWPNTFSLSRCINGELQVSRCCDSYTFQNNWCQRI